MDYLQEAESYCDRSFGDGYNAEQRDRLVQIAMMYAAIAQAEAMTGIVNALGKLIPISIDIQTIANIVADRDYETADSVIADGVHALKEIEKTITLMDR